MEEDGNQSSINLSEYLEQAYDKYEPSKNQY
jgi:hypothetical protein